MTAFSVVFFFVCFFQRIIRYKMRGFDHLLRSLFHTFYIIHIAPQKSYYTESNATFSVNNLQSNIRVNREASFQVHSRANWLLCTFAT